MVDNEGVLLNPQILDLLTRWHSRLNTGFGGVYFLSTEPGDRLLPPDPCALEGVGKIGPGTERHMLSSQAGHRGVHSALCFLSTGQ